MEARLRSSYQEHSTAPVHSNNSPAAAVAAARAGAVELLRRLLRLALPRSRIADVADALAHRRLLEVDCAPLGELGHHVLDQGLVRVGLRP
eukprot:CAMPEP_0170135992 /NCGR_PEP_ID=MMETSP0033_2-20121228/2896_1 /TAXON_ID=195969 /ORGANISM="Dolichomastix tenuilepis, Strain CCMP3274" /LENGTH=90 /DNA_ID=CAMNT_0010371641 /DNA_START=246 /DNA_END=515 /DNA_ORIENTATION=-